jgi:hypothetical protein
MLMIVMTEPEANEVRALTSHAGNRIEPRKIEAGDNAGQYAVPARSASDPAHEHVWGFLNQCPIVDIEPATAWPASEE